MHDAGADRSELLAQTLDLPDRYAQSEPWMIDELNRVREAERGSFLNDLDDGQLPSAGSEHQDLGVLLEFVIASRRGTR